MDVGHGEGYIVFVPIWFTDLAARSPKPSTFDILRANQKRHFAISIGQPGFIKSSWI